MKSTPDISVVIPIYGLVHKSFLLPIISSLTEQVNVDIEILIVQELLGNENAITFDNSIQNLKCINAFSDSYYYNPGAIRNLGAKESEGRYLYFTDADIYYWQTRYFSKLIETSNDESVLVTPKLKHLLEYDQESVLDSLTFGSEWEDITKQCHEYAFVSKNYTKEILIAESKNSHGRSYFSDNQLFYENYKAGASFKGEEPKYWKGLQHDGAVFIDRSYFLSIGGYSIGFRNWGCEDSYLKSKIEKISGTKNADVSSLKPQLSVIHFDHQKPYFDKHQFADNKMMESRLLNRGSDAIIEQDLTDFQLKYYSKIDTKAY